MNPFPPAACAGSFLAEFEERTKQPMRIILSGMSGEAYVIKAAKELLPLTFTSGI